MFALGALDLAGGQLHDLVAVLRGDLRMGLHVVVPGRVLWIAALGGDHGVLAVLLDAHQWHKALLAGLGAGGGEQHDRAVQDLDPVGGAVLDDAFGLFAYPVGGAQLGVVSHRANNSTPGAGYSTS